MWIGIYIMKHMTRIKSQCSLDGLVVLVTGNVDKTLEASACTGGTGVNINF